MTTKRETIVARILTVVTPTTGISNRAYRDRVTALSRTEMPSILVEAVSDGAEQTSSINSLDWTLTVKCSVMVQSSNPVTAADGIVENMHSRLMADVTLNGNAVDITPSGVTVEVIDADQAIGVIGCDYIVRYRTLTADLTQ